MTLTLDRIMQELESNRATLRDMGVVELAVFGSALRGGLPEGSDLDFLVELREKSFDMYMDVKIFLEDLFDRRVDLVLRDTIKPKLRAAIEESAVRALISKESAYFVSPRIEEHK